MGRPMHVAVVNLTSGGLSGGYKKYLATLLPLQRDDPRVGRLDVFSPPGASISAVDGVGFHSWPANDRRRGYAGLRSQLATISPDVIFVPTAAFVRTGIPTTVMVRNMEPLLVPFQGNTVSDGIKNAVRRHVARRSCELAQRVIAVSRHVRDYIHDEWKIPVDRIGTVYHGVEPALPAERCIRPGTLPELDAPMVFTAGSIRPARGLEDVIEAMAQIPADVARPVLVIAGETNPGSEGYRAKMQRLVSRLRLDGRVHWAGQLDRAEMGWCFRQCAIFVMTSRAEACPNTVLEAMSYGAVAVSGDNPPMPEIFSDAALYYPSGSINILAERLRTLVAPRSATLQHELRAAAFTRAKQFSWAECARNTVSELTTCAAMARK